MLSLYEAHMEALILILMVNLEDRCYCLYFTNESLKRQKELGQGHPPTKWWSRDSNPSSMVPTPMRRKVSSGSLN